MNELIPEEDLEIERFVHILESLFDLNERDFRLRYLEFLIDRYRKVKIEEMSMKDHFR